MTTSLTKVKSPLTMNILRRFTGAGALPSLLGLFILIVYPLAALLLQIVFPHVYDVRMSFVPSFTAFAHVFSDPLNAEAVLNSLGIGVAASVVSVVLGTITAYGAAKAPRRLKVLIDLFVWVVFFTPSYVIAQGWIIFMQNSGIASQLLGLPNGWSAWFFTRYGLVVAMGLRYFPFVHMAMEQAIANLSHTLHNAARTLGANQRQVFMRITLRLLAPALFAGASISFAEGFGDFGFAAAITPQTNIPLLSYQIYSALNQAPVDYPAAAVLSLLLIIITAFTLLLQMWWLKRGSYETVSSGSAAYTSVSVGAPRRMSGVTVGSLVIAGLALVLPVGSILCASFWKTWLNGFALGNWTIHNYVQAIGVGSDGAAAFLRSFEYSLVVAVITTAFGLVTSYKMAFSKSVATRILNTVTMATMAVPGVVMAAGFIFAWNAVWLIGIHLVLYGTAACLAMAYIAGSLPYVIRLQVGAMSQLSPSLLRAARVLGARNTTVVFKIVLPLVISTTVSTFFLTFTGTMFELPASSLLYPAGYPTFSVVIQSFFNNFEWSIGSSLTMIGLLFVFAAYLLGRVIVNRMSRGRENNHSVGQLSK